LHYDEQREEHEQQTKPVSPYANKYDRIIVGKYGSGKCVVDVYRVLYAFPSGCPDIDHAIKKLLAPGKRGAKDELQDLKEAIQSIEARISYLNETGA
jgi:RecG-like helicase